MHWKRTLTSIAIGAAVLAGITAPAASASTSPAANPVGASAAGSVYHLCNLTGSLSVYGCAMTHGKLKAVTLVSLDTSSLTNFSYDASTEQFIQAGTDLCLEFNASSTKYPVRMDTCNSSVLSQIWFLGDYTAYQIVNYYASVYYNEDECLEGSEEIGFGHQLAMSPCSDEYDGENWVAVS